MDESNKGGKVNAAVVPARKRLGQKRRLVVARSGFGDRLLPDQQQQDKAHSHVPLQSPSDPLFVRGVRHFVCCEQTRAVRTGTRKMTPRHDRFTRYGITCNMYTTEKSLLQQVLAYVKQGRRLLYACFLST